MFSRKVYESTASILAAQYRAAKTTASRAAIERLAADFATAYKTDNDRFDRQKFAYAVFGRPEDKPKRQRIRREAIAVCCTLPPYSEIVRRNG
jgi:hypothetical protein